MTWKGIKNSHLISDIRDWNNSNRFCCATVRKDDLTKVEDNLLNAYIPPANDQYPAEMYRIIGAFR